MGRRVFSYRMPEVMDEFISGSFVLHNFSFVVQTNMYEPRKSLERTGRGGSVVFSYLLVV